MKRCRLSLALVALLVLPAAASAQPQPGFLLETATFGPAGGAFTIITTPALGSHVQQFAAPFSIGTLSQVTGIGAGNISSGTGTLFAAIVTNLGDPFTDSSVVAATVFTAAAGSGDLRVPLTATLLPGQYYLVIGTGRFGASTTNGTFALTGVLIGTPSIQFYTPANQRFFPLVGFSLRLVVTGGPDTGHTFVVNSINSFTNTRASQGSVNDVLTGVGIANANILTRASQGSVDTANTNILTRSSQDSLDAFAAGVAANFSKMFTGADARASQTSLDTLTTSSVATGTQVSSIDASVGTANTALSSLSTSVGSLNSAIALLPQQADLTAVATSVTQNVLTRASQASVDALAATLGADTSLRLAIEEALSEGRRIASFLLPESVGGKLEVVRDVVDDIIVAAQQAGLKVSKARAALLKGDAARIAGNFRTAYDWYTNAYQLIARTDDRDEHDRDER